MFYPLHRQPCFKFLNYGDEDFAESIDAYDRGISFPVHCSLKDEDIVYLSNQVKAFYKG
jgi:dTDP-4-amino-4,6-dideoxygalactose transaminase